MKYAYQTELVINEAIKQYPKGRFLFLTLTIKNVSGEDLNKTISEMGVGFNRLMKYKKVDKNILGYLRATEVTYSKDYENYHPHLHVLLMVKPNYFNSRGDNYITQKDWGKLWSKAMKLDYVPMVDIRTVKPKKETVSKKNSLKKAILETSKYPVKPFDMEKDKNGKRIIYDEETKLKITDDMMNGLYRKRQVGFGKLFKELKAKLKLDDVEDGNLVQVGTEEDSENAGRDIIAIWNWERKNYFVKSMDL